MNRMSLQETSGDDLREGLTAIVSIKIPEPQFEGQTKQKLGNAEARTAVEGLVTEKLTYFLEQNPQVAKAIVGKAVVAQRAREAARKARDVACSDPNPKNCEIYIVEEIPPVAPQRLPDPVQHRLSCPCVVRF